MKWNERLEKALADQARNRSEIERKIGLGKDRINKMIAGRQPRVADALRLCRFLDLDPYELFLDDATKKALQSVTPEKPRAVKGLRRFAVAIGKYVGRRSLKVQGESETRDPEELTDRAGYVPIIAPVAAGLPREAHDGDYLAGDAEAFVRFDTDNAAAFALRVDGDSMAPDFRHGDIIIVSPSGPPKDAFRDGMAAVVIFHEERTCAFKLVDFTRGKTAATGVYLLSPINKRHPPLRLNVGEVAAIYPVVGLVRKGV